MNEFSSKYKMGYALSFNALKAEYDEYSDVLKKQLYPVEEVKPDVEEIKPTEEVTKETVEEATDKVKVAKEESKPEEPEMEMKCVMVPKTIAKDESAEKVKA